MNNQAEWKVITSNDPVNTGNGIQDYLGSGLPKTKLKNGDFYYKYDATNQVLMIGAEILLVLLWSSIRLQVQTTSNVCELFGTLYFILKEYTKDVRGNSGNVGIGLLAAS